MTGPRLDPLIEAFYRDRYDEDARLRATPHGRLEFLRTRELLRRLLPPPPGRLLDVGGGTGVHARWLAGDGWSVQLLDPVPHHVAAAPRIPGVSVALGDARALPWADDRADVVLLLGPLYHLTDPADRARALAEAVRVTRRGGTVAVAAISRYAALLELAALGVLDDAAEAECRALIATGHNEDDPEGFTTAHMHLPDELRAELSAAGLRDVIVLGVEGPSAPALDNVALDNTEGEDVEAVLDSAVRCGRVVEADPLLMAASPHLLGVGTVD